MSFLRGRKPCLSLLDTVVEPPLNRFQIPFLNLVFSVWFDIEIELSRVNENRQNRHSNGENIGNLFEAMQHIH